MTHALLLSADGVGDALGYSQVFRVALGLRQRGFEVSLVTVEMPAHAARCAQIERQAEAAGIRYRYALRGEGGSMVQFARNSHTMRALAEPLAKHAHVVLARAFPTGPLASYLRLRHGVPFVYDIRGFWVDQRLAAPLVSPAVERAARMTEAGVYRLASAVVSLTALGAEAVRAGQFGAFDEQKWIEVIPTCVDYDEFRLARADEDPFAALPEAIAAKLRGRLVVGYVGSLNRDYLAEASCALAAKILTKRDDAVFLVMSAQADALRALCDAQGIELDRCVFVQVPHDQVASYLRCVDYGLLLLDTRPDKAGSMPTKLAEFLACGVRPLHLGCNAEVGAWVRRTGSGYALEDASDAALEACAEHVAHAPRSRAALEHAREVAEPHFALERGLSRYAALLERAARLG